MKPDEKEKRPLMTGPDVMKYLGIGRALAHELLQGVPPVKIGSRTVYDRADVDAAIDARKALRE